MSTKTEGFDQIVQTVAAAINGSRRIAVLSGAGMSADSGLPTYRGIGGLYNEMEVEEGMPIEAILHTYTFARNPALTWKYLAQIERACHGAAPNLGHRVLAAWERRFEMCVVTQNVDGFHRAVGSTNVIELHGNLRQLYCCDCGDHSVVDDFDMLTLPLRCTKCDGLVRPDVVLFGEKLPPGAMAAYERALGTGFDVMFTVGTTAAFPYIQGPMQEATRRACITVEINPDVTVLSDQVTFTLRASALTALTAIDAELSRLGT